jgi:hypothetical protein
MPLLFSYGTLQQEEVQVAIFERKLRGDQDELVGYEQAPLIIELTQAELLRADRYEVSAYKRIAANLASGREAWVYVDARVADPLL